MPSGDALPRRGTASTHALTLWWVFVGEELHSRWRGRLLSGPAVTREALPESAAAANTISGLVFVSRPSCPHSY